MKLDFNKTNYISSDKFFFADSAENISAKFSLEDNNNNLLLNTNSFFSEIHSNLFRVEIQNPQTGKKEEVDVFNNAACRQIYFRIPGEHEIDGRKFEAELQFNCTVTAKDTIHGQSIESTFNFFVAYPIGLSQDGSNRQLDFFEDVQKGAKIGLGKEFDIKGVSEIMNNFNMFNKVYFYRGNFF